MEQHDDQNPDELVVPFRRFIGYAINKSPDPKDEGSDSQHNEKQKQETECFKHVFYPSPRARLNSGDADCNLFSHYFPTSLILVGRRTK